MLHTVAVLSDIHGALPALDAVLAEPLVAAADLVVATGDSAAGPLPVETLDRLAELGDRLVLVRGNADRELVALARGEEVDAPDVSQWAAQQLGATHLDTLATLPHPVVLAVDGFGDVLFCHGSPRDDNEVLLVDTRLDRWAEAFSGVPDSVTTIVCGHTHMPFVRLVDRRLVINSGSVGMPYGVGAASWALLDRGTVSLHRTRLDPDAAAAVFRERSAFPQIEEWLSDYLLEQASDAEALRVFAPRDGR